MKHKKLLSFLLAAVMTISLLPAFTIAVTAEETPDVTISTLEELEKFRLNIADGNSYSGKLIKLTADIDMRGYYGADIEGKEKSWGPIGLAPEFKGTFDGGNHKIIGLYSNRKEYCISLFAIINGNATVKNLGIEGGSINGEGYVGGIAGYNRGTIENCYSTAEIIGGDDVGGIVGFNEGKIINCYNVGNIKGTGDGVGGVVGANFGGTIESCYYLAGTAEGGINGSDVEGSAESKEKEKFENGIVAYLLQGTQSTQIWGQRLKGDNADKYPVLSSNDKVYKISFMTKSGDGYTQCAEAGANADGMAKEKLPKPDSDDYEFVKWVTEPNISASEFNEKIAVTGDMTVYALGNEVTEATLEKNYTIEMTYDEEIDEINLNDYVENKSGNSDSFTFTLTKGSLPEGLSFNQETGKITGTPEMVET